MAYIEDSKKNVLSWRITTFMPNERLKNNHLNWRTRLLSSRWTCQAPRFKGSTRCAHAYAESPPPLTEALQKGFATELCRSKSAAAILPSVQGSNGISITSAWCLLPAPFSITWGQRAREPRGGTALAPGSCHLVHLLLAWPQPASSSLGWLPCRRTPRLTPIGGPNLGFSAERQWLR